MSHATALPCLARARERITRPASANGLQRGGDVGHAHEDGRLASASVPTETCVMLTPARPSLAAFSASAPGLSELDLDDLLLHDVPALRRERLPRGRAHLSTMTRTTPSVPSIQAFTGAQVDLLRGERLGDLAQRARSIRGCGLSSFALGIGVPPVGAHRTRTRDKGNRSCGCHAAWPPSARRASGRSRSYGPAPDGAGVGARLGSGYIPQWTTSPASARTSAGPRSR